MSWQLAARLARRELRGGLHGFRIFLISSGYGILMEFVQAGFTNRAFEGLDILADLSGAALAWLLVSLTNKQKNKPL